MNSDLANQVMDAIQTETKKTPNNVANVLLTAIIHLYDDPKFSMILEDAVGDNEAIIQAVRIDRADTILRDNMDREKTDRLLRLIHDDWCEVPKRPQLLAIVEAMIEEKNLKTKPEAKKK